ncbi:MAG: hypothetical protein NTX54_00215, partial [Chloroflexi bacterium]|nr:hypothetical protein [Chloroflexota bacterium]
PTGMMLMAFIGLLQDHALIGRAARRQWAMNGCGNCILALDALLDTPTLQRRCKGSIPGSEGFRKWIIVTRPP